MLVYKKDKERLFANKYRLLKKLAAGGMAEVFLALHVGLGGFEKKVVLKKIHPKLASDKKYIQLFLDEARLSALLHHPNIIQIFEVGEDNGEYFIAMEYLSGADAGTIFEWFKVNRRVIDQLHTVGIIMDVARGLHYAHSVGGAEKDGGMGIIHQDICPKNLFVTNDGTTKILDFGIAKPASNFNRERSHELVGHSAYMSPEQLLGECLDSRSDVYSLGVVLYEFLTAQRLFKREEQLEIIRAITRGQIVPPVALVACPPILSAITMKALAKRREDRFSNAHEFLSALEEFTAQAKLHIDVSEREHFWSQIFRNMNDDDATAESSLDSFPVVGNKKRAASSVILAIASGGGLGATLMLSSLFFMPAGRSGGAADEVIEYEMPLVSQMSQMIDNSSRGGSTFLAKNGRLKITMVPWAHVYIDQKYVGQTPLELSLPPGKHEVALSNQTFKKKWLTHVVIRPSEDTLLAHSW
jgi:serine/threonine-protein kinase